MTSKVAHRKTIGEKPFPKLMVSNRNNIVLMWGRDSNGTGTGVLLSAATYTIHECGKPRTDWIMDTFTDFDGTIELSNG